MKRIFHILLFLLVVVCITAFIRLFFYSIAIVSDKGHEPSLLQGDRVVVELRSYGWLPFTEKRGWSWQEAPKRGEWVAFHSPAVERGAQPDTSPLFIGRILAVPGDTVWMGKNGHVENHRSYGTGSVWPLSIPANGTHVKLSAWNRPLYQQMISRHEPDTTTLGDDSFIDQSYDEHYRFHHDYYWISSGSEENLMDSRTLGPVPKEFLVGKVGMVLYSLDKGKPFWQSWRRSRTLFAIE